jgi:cell division protein FtsQ|tara:strand:+ start:34 stop:711 length:678 start_codon:yes stop_codon:yes gene_type:complete
MHQSIGKKNKIAIYIIFILILSTINWRFVEPQKKYNLKIDKIEVIGLSNSKNLEIKNELSNIFYQNIFILKREEINRIINQHNIIEEYNIKKIYPSTLNIDIKPTKFVARISDNNQLIVGSNGKLILSYQSNQKLPYIFGEFKSKEFLEFKKNIDQSKFNFSEFKTVYLFPSNRWDISTNDDILIKLPLNNMSESLNTAYRILDSTQFKDKNIIDLRIKNHLIVK